MKFQPLFILFAFVVVSFWSSCETDFELEGDWKDIPVLYAFLSEQDTAYYVRVERAFLEPGGNALEIAQIPDSFYYDDNQVSVKLERLSNGQTFELQRVDGRDEGYPRVTGDFANEPNYLYKLRRSQTTLNGGTDFRIIVEREGEEPATATSTIVREIELANLPLDGFMRFGDFTRDSKVEWRITGEDARVFDIRLKFRYRETDPENPGNRITKEIEWVLDQDLTRVDGSSLQTFRFPNESFYQFLDTELEPLATGTRKFDAVVFEVTAGGVEIEDYLRIANANIGITSAQAIPSYTNVENGVGIVTSRYKVTSFDLGLAAVARDSLYGSSYTKDLNFVP